MGVYGQDKEWEETAVNLADDALLFGWSPRCLAMVRCDDCDGS